MRTFASSLAAVAICAAALAQTQNIVYHPDNVASVGTANAFPFGATGCRIQQLIPQSVLGTPGVIQDLFIAPQIDSGNLYQESEIFYGDFEIRMGLTQVTALSTTWANNSPNPTTVYRGPLRLRFLRDQWVPIGLPASYLWLPLTPSDNLVIDFINWAVIDTGAVRPSSATGYYMNVRSGGIPRAYLRSWTGSQPPTSQSVDSYGIKLGFLFNDGNFVVHGGGCAGSSTQAPWIGVAPGTWPQMGGTLDVRLTQGPASLFANLVLGLNNRLLGGTVPLPLDLGFAGAPGCMAWHEPLAILSPSITSPTGDASSLIPVPNLPGLMSLRLYATWLCFDPTANAIGLTTSGFGSIIIGS